MRIVVIGTSGAGKTTMAQRVAAKLDLLRLRTPRDATKVVDQLRMSV